VAEWPLIGRERELEVLRRWLSGDDRRGVVLAGPAGVGKTRLAVECLAEAERAGLPNARVSATRAAAHLPFGAMAPLLPAADGPGVGVGDQANFLRRCCRAVVERAGSRRFVLLVDDAHLLDDASATLVHQLATTGAAAVLATVRVGEPAPDPVVALWKDGLAERIDIGGLGPDGVEEVLTVVLGGPLDRASQHDGEDLFDAVGPQATDVDALGQPDRKSVV